MGPKLFCDMGGAGHGWFSKYPSRSRWSKQTREKCGWNSEKLREERRVELVSIFKYFIPPTNQRTSRRKNCSYQNVCKKMGVGGFYTLVMSV